MSGKKVEIKLKPEDVTSLGISVVTYENCDYTINDKFIIITEKVGDSVLITPHNLNIVYKIKITNN